MTVDQILNKIDYAIDNKIPYIGLAFKNKNILISPNSNFEGLKNKELLKQFKDIYYGADANSILNQALVPESSAKEKPLNSLYLTETYPLKYDNMADTKVTWSLTDSLSCADPKWTITIPPQKEEISLTESFKNMLSNSSNDSDSYNDLFPTGSFKFETLTNFMDSPFKKDSTSYDNVCKEYRDSLKFNSCDCNNCEESCQGCNTTKLDKMKQLNNTIGEIKYKHDCKKNQYDFNNSWQSAFVVPENVNIDSSYTFNNDTKSNSNTSDDKQTKLQWVYAPDNKDCKYDYDYQFKKISSTQLKELLSSLSEDELAKLGYKVL